MRWGSVSKAVEKLAELIFREDDDAREDGLDKTETDMDRLPLVTRPINSVSSKNDATSAEIVLAMANDDDDVKLTIMEKMFLLCYNSSKKERKSMHKGREREER